MSDQERFDSRCICKVMGGKVLVAPGCPDSLHDAIARDSAEHSSPQEDK